MVSVGIAIVADTDDSPDCEGDNSNPLGKQRNICKHNIYGIYRCVHVSLCTHVYLAHRTHTNTRIICFDGMVIISIVFFYFS